MDTGRGDWLGMITTPAKKSFNLCIPDRLTGEGSRVGVAENMNAHTGCMVVTIAAIRTHCCICCHSSLLNLASCLV